MEQIKLNTSDEILKKVKRLQNGDVSRGMTRMGIYYKLNYGVSIPQLRQMANTYVPNNDLAFNLFNKDIREAKIMASMLFDVSNITTKSLMTVSGTIDNVELVEQFSRNVFSNYSDLSALLVELFKGNNWQKVLALYSASWYFKINKTPNPEIIDWSINQISAVQENEDGLYIKGLSFLLQSMASINEEQHLKIVNLAESMLKAEIISAQKLAEEFLWLNVT